MCGPCTGEFEFFKKYPYRGVGPVPVPKDFEFFRKNPYRGVGPVLGTLSFFEKNPYGGVPIGIWSSPMPQRKKNVGFIDFILQKMQKNLLKRWLIQDYNVYVKTLPKCGY